MSQGIIDTQALMTTHLDDAPPEFFASLRDEEGIEHAYRVRRKLWTPSVDGGRGWVNTGYVLRLRAVVLNSIGVAPRNGVWPGDGKLHIVRNRLDSTGAVVFKASLDELFTAGEKGVHVPGEDEAPEDVEFVDIQINDVLYVIVGDYVVDADLVLVATGFRKASPGTPEEEAAEHAIQEGLLEPTGGDEFTEIFEHGGNLP